MSESVKVCSIGGCQREKYGLGFCSKHYQRFKKHGDPLFNLNPRREKIEIPEGYVQVCTKHGLLKLYEVYRHHERNKIVYLKCKKCVNKRTREWEKRNPEAVKKIRHRNYLKSIKLNSKKSILRQQKLTQSEYDKMFVDQKDRCAICDNLETKKRKDGTISPLCVDHCHSTGKVRALLCANCNSGIGFLKENREYLIKAAEYVDFWNKKYLRDSKYV